MTDIIINGLFSLGGVLLGGLLSWLAARDSKRICLLEHDKADLQKAVSKLGNQVKAYWQLEDLYAKEIEGIAGTKKAKTIKTEHRDVIEAQGNTRPEMTSKDVDDMFEKVL